MRVGTVVVAVKERIIAPSEAQRSVRTSPIAPRAISETQGEAGAVSEVGIAIEDVPAVGSQAIRRAIEAVEVAGVRIRTVVVPVVLIVHLLFYITVLVVAANQDVPVIAIIGYDLIQIAVGALHDRQLRVAARQSQRGHKQEGQHRNPSGHPAHQVVVSRNGQHVGVPSLIEPPAWWRTRLLSRAVRSESVCVDAAMGICWWMASEPAYPAAFVIIIVRPCTSGIGPGGIGSLTR